MHCEAPYRLNYMFFFESDAIQMLQNRMKQAEGSFNGFFRNSIKHPGFDILAIHTCQLLPVFLATRWPSPQED